MGMLLDGSRWVMEVKFGMVVLLGVRSLLRTLGSGLDG